MNKLNWRFIFLSVIIASIVALMGTIITYVPSEYIYTGVMLVGVIIALAYTSILATHMILSIKKNLEDKN